MAFSSLAQELEGLLPPKVKEFLVSLAAEVDSHKQAITDLASIGGPVGATVATVAEEVAAQVESPTPATAAPSTTSTSGEVPKEAAPVEHQGNPEQALPYEAWPKSE